MGHEWKTSGQEESTSDLLGDLTFEWLRVHDLAKDYSQPSRANLSHAEEIGRIIIPLTRHYIFHPEVSPLTQCLKFCWGIRFESLPLHDKHFTD